jgi:hypothetical protein
MVLLVDSAEARAPEWTRFELACADKLKIPVMRILPSRLRAVRSDSIVHLGGTPSDLSALSCYAESFNPCTPTEGRVAGGRR